MFGARCEILVDASEKFSPASFRPTLIDLRGENKTLDHQFFRILCGALARVTTITLVVGMLVTSALAQNPVPPTA